MPMNANNELYISILPLIHSNKSITSSSKFRCKHCYSHCPYISTLYEWWNNLISLSPIISMAFMLMPASKTWNVVDVLGTQDATVNITMKGKSYLGKLYIEAQRTIHLTESQ